MTGDPRFLAIAAAAAATLLVVVFLRAALHKAADVARFAGYLDDYRLLSERFVEPAAKALVALELGTVGLLVWPATARVGAGLAFALLALYGAAIAINLGRGRRRIDCGCGGPAQPLSPALLWRNAVLAGLALLPLTHGTGALGFGEAAAAVSSGLMLFLFVTLAEQTLANDGHLRLIRDTLTGKGPVP